MIRRARNTTWPGSTPSTSSPPPSPRSAAQRSKPPPAPDQARHLTKRRADQLLVDQGLAETRTKAQALILAGVVFTGEQRIDKAGTNFDDATELRLAGRDHPWVSRGGLKLAHAIAHFGLDPSGLTALDIGASTGGFTDVLLAHGAAKVHAVDVGRGQLAWKLRQDPRVIVHDGTNARYLTRAEIPDPVDLVACDASFIGLKTILPAPLALTAATAALVALIKPQFEAGARRVGKGGVVRDPEVHLEVCSRIAEWLAAQPGWHVDGITESPITGPAGNKEFLLYARRH
jgi:23S rRNA (cytidine1920-2'-O)/16S rRNA (cytidine1409-2'-O)-methyltransferase